MEYKHITIEGRPIAKSNLYGVRVVGRQISVGGQKAIVNPKGIIYTTRDLEDYEIEIGKKVESVITETLTTYQSLYVRVYQHGKRWIDVDNCFKAIQDSMDNSKIIKRGKKEIQVCKTGIANDKLFQLIVGERIHVENADEQRVELIIEEYQGLFHLADTVKSHYGLTYDYVNGLLLPDVK